ncbi:GGDEF domain-containing protein [Breoghania sp.]|uniref:GGDEF domain-containing protein n=1 Tax=Breoghania sp. TaxID=2065378 RepID=UPI0026238829|nr:GGDEF domain-containing protein [Breoghania sp.]MDJ0932431.1 GGDEF domain-containing protein [Breoghania sp.]
MEDMGRCMEDLRDEVARLTDVVTSQRLEIRRLRRDAVRDALTELLNRCGFERVLERSIAFVSRYNSDVSLLHARSCRQRRGADACVRGSVPHAASLRCHQADRGD